MLYIELYKKTVLIICYFSLSLSLSFSLIFNIFFLHKTSINVIIILPFSTYLINIPLKAGYYTKKYIIDIYIYIYIYIIITIYILILVLCKKKCSIYTYIYIYIYMKNKLL